MAESFYASWLGDGNLYSGCMLLGEIKDGMLNAALSFYVTEIILRAILAAIYTNLQLSYHISS